MEGHVKPKAAATRSFGDVYTR